VLPLVLSRVIDICDRYLCQRLVRVALKVQVQTERDFVEIIRAQLCRAHTVQLWAGGCLHKSVRRLYNLFHSHLRHSVNLFPLLVCWDSFSFFPYWCSVSIHFSRPVFLLLIYFTVTSHATQRFLRRMYFISDLWLPTQFTWALRSSRMLRKVEF
jgi:hypothetical protein